ncbi:hypothetical protein V8J88_14515 [Massilia sp. W12]|uniref:hypothetical protein n=1 Tax=Massilia sp. W12 TaxID=3126507 RepID=UPI0030D117CE
MPLYQDALYLIKANLEECARGGKVRAVAIGKFSASQYATINASRAANNLPPLENPEIVFLGSHLYKSRVVRDAYTIQDVITQISSATADSAVVIINSRMTATRSNSLRKDGYGNMVLDEAIYELTQRKPRAELFSVIPKGDKIKPNQGKNQSE